ncbi:MAG TPA: BACON domain-containing protein [Candidatus Phocaeicola excrementigallinarum]|nr:BACON domain-containing protein [Candidatus Phocaeicola excrementigallinarum]
MNRICKNFIILTVALTISNVIVAQNACDKLFAEGVKLQQTMTIYSQQKAIEQFKKAKICYDSQTKKDLCDQQITACRNIIAQIKKNDMAEKKDDPTPPQPSSITADNNDNQHTETIDKRDVKLSLNKTYIKFKGKGGEFQKVKVTCNYDDWEVSDAPEWVNYSRNENNELVIETEKNPDKDERSGILKVRCGETETSLTIIQDKFKKFIIL